MPSAGKHLTGAERGKTLKGCLARENIKRVACAGKHTTGVKSGKTYTCKAPELMQRAPSVESAKNQDKLTFFPGILEKVGLLRFKVTTGGISFFGKNNFKNKQTQNRRKGDHYPRDSMENLSLIYLQSYGAYLW